MKQKVKFNMPPLGKQYANKIIGKQQNIVKNPVTKDQATQQITEVINNSGMPPQMFVEIGQLAEQAIQDPKQYKNFVDYMVTKKLETAEDLKKPDYQMLASMVVIGKVAETLSEQGQQPTEKTQEVQEQVSEPVMPTQGL